MNFKNQEGNDIKENKKITELDLEKKTHKLTKLSEIIMAKPATLQIKLLSTADTGTFYVTKKNPRTKPEKLELKKYDPKIRKHVIFKEAKIK